MPAHRYKQVYSTSVKQLCAADPGHAGSWSETAAAYVGMCACALIIYDACASVQGLWHDLALQDADRGEVHACGRFRFAGRSAASLGNNSSNTNSSSSSSTTTTNNNNDNHHTYANTNSNGNTNTTTHGSTCSEFVKHLRLELHSTSELMESSYLACLSLSRHRRREGHRGITWHLPSATRRGVQSQRSQVASLHILTMLLSRQSSHVYAVT